VAPRALIEELRLLTQALVRGRSDMKTISCSGNRAQASPLRASGWVMRGPTLKACLVHVGLQVLRDGDQVRVALITRLLRERGLGHA
jgi:hypothetical protein